MPTKQVPDLSALKIDDHSRTGGGRKWLRYVAAAIGVLFLIFAVGFMVVGKAPVVQTATAHSVAGGETRVALLNASGYVTPRVRA